MIIYSKSGVIAVWKWGGMYYDPITPTGYIEWIRDNPHLLPYVKSQHQNAH